MSLWKRILGRRIEPESEIGPESEAAPLAQSFVRPTPMFVSNAETEYYVVDLAELIQKTPSQEQACLKFFNRFHYDKENLQDEKKARLLYLACAHRHWHLAEAMIKAAKQADRARALVECFRAPMTPDQSKVINDLLHCVQYTDNREHVVDTLMNSLEIPDDDATINRLDLKALRDLFAEAVLKACQEKRPKCIRPAWGPIINSATGASTKIAVEQSFTTLVDQDNIPVLQSLIDAGLKPQEQAIAHAASKEKWSIAAILLDAGAIVTDDTRKIIEKKAPRKTPQADAIVTKPAATYVRDDSWIEKFRGSEDGRKLRPFDFEEMVADYQYQVSKSEKARDKKLNDLIANEAALDQDIAKLELFGQKKPRGVQSINLDTLGPVGSPTRTQAAIEYAAVTAERLRQRSHVKVSDRNKTDPKFIAYLLWLPDDPSSRIKPLRDWAVDEYRRICDEKANNWPIHLWEEELLKLAGAPKHAAALKGRADAPLFVDGLESQNTNLGQFTR